MQEKLSNIIETVIDFYYKKINNSWIHKSFHIFLDYLVINNNKIKLVSNMSEIKDNTKDKLKKGEYSFKVKYFKKNIMPKKKIEKFLYKFIKKTNLEWKNLINEHDFIKKTLFKFIQKKLQKKIEN